MSGKLEVDESYFGAKRVRGKRGRGTGRKSFYFVKPLVAVSKRLAKTLG
ncbi:hypothetical protein [Campylobacter troglodytis]|nr:hypothetical protein [Campylobacter troglodytis]